MSSLTELDRSIREGLHRANHILVFAHIRPDGDALGSLLAMGLALSANGQSCEMVLEDGVPASFKHLSGWELIRQKPEKQADLVVTLDCSDLSRVSNKQMNPLQVDINIDHHITNLNFGKLNLVEPTAVATAEILARRLPVWGYSITAPVAEALLTGLVTDTLGFRTNNMTPEALRVAANLMEVGANLSDLYYRGLIGRSFEAVKYWGKGINRLHRQDRLIWTSLTQSDRWEAQYPGRDDADIINILSEIEDTDVVVLFNEQGNGQVKVSWRSRPGYDITPLALQFGGGGHPAAAGADVEGTLPEVEVKVLQSTRNYLNSIGNG